jgi:pre-mRNA-processing factor 6
VLWLFAAKEAWLGGDVARARQVLTEAFAANPGREAVWLAAVKLEWESGELALARALLERARAAAPSARVWLKSALLEREAGAAARERELLAEGTARFPAAPKLWMMRGQAEERAGALEAARAAYAAGLRAAPAALPLWTLAAALEEAAGRGAPAGFARARTLLESARLRNPGQPALWLAGVRLERRAGAPHAAETLLARALKECPGAGLLLAEDIEAAPRAAQRRKSADALARADADAHVVLAVARLFAAERKADKARKWFARAAALRPDFGDALAAAYAFECEAGDAAEAARIERAAAAAEPTHGERWQAVAKAPGAHGLSKVEVLKRCAAQIREEDARRRAAALEEGARG